MTKESAEQRRQIGLEFPINETLHPTMETTADQILDYSLEVKRGDVVMIKLSDGEYAHQFCQVVVPKIRERGATVLLQRLIPSMNNNFVSDNRLLEDMSRRDRDFALPMHVEKSGDENEDAATFFELGPQADDRLFLTEATKLLIIRTRVGDIDPFTQKPREYSIEPELKNAVGQMSKKLTDIRLDITSGTLKNWCLIVVPTPEAPKPPNMTSEEFAKLYFDACSLDWEKVTEAQKVLVDMYSGREEISIHVPSPEGIGDAWTTDIVMKTTDQRFANSVARQNMPGAEVFAAPTIEIIDGQRKGTLHGTLAVPYPVWFINRVLPNLRLEFTDGKVTQWYTDASDDDKKFLEETLQTDEGASWIGEIGFGTNKNVDVPPPDTMLAEKAFGFHLALGDSHRQKTYLGEPVQLDNGNMSQIHVDIPRLMLPQFGGGTITVDGKLVFENGRYLDERLAVLNP